VEDLGRTRQASAVVGRIRLEYPLDRRCGA
jgi:hypothetical protein